MAEKPKQFEFPEMPDSSRVLQEAIMEFEAKDKLKQKSPEDKIREIADELRKGENPNEKNLKDLLPEKK